MKNIVLSLNRAGLYAEVSRMTAYMGVKQAPLEGAGDHFDRIALAEQDNPLLDVFVGEGISELAERLRGVVTGVESGSDTVVVTLTLSDGYDDCLTATLSGDFEAYMTAFLLSRWLRLADPQKGSVWQGEMERLLGKITAIVYHRSPPRRSNSTFVNES